LLANTNLAVAACSMVSHWSTAAGNFSIIHMLPSSDLGHVTRRRTAVHAATSIAAWSAAMSSSTLLLCMHEMMKL
jgi:hypothetical protein